MKNWKHYLIVCFMALIVLTFIACEDDPPEVIREFNDLTFLGKYIKLIDETNNSKDLKTRGIWQQIQNGLNATTATPESIFGTKFFKIYNTGNFGIIIESNANYNNGFYGVNGYKVLLCELQLIEYSSLDIIGCIQAAISSDMIIE